MALAVNSGVETLAKCPGNVAGFNLDFGVCPMKVLVTGSSGRIGSAVVELLVASGHDAVGLDLCPSGRVLVGLKEIVASLDDPASIQRAVAGCDAVLHLGALMSWVHGDEDKMYKANVEGTRYLLNASAAAGIDRFVFASSGEVYPESCPVSKPIDEEHPLRANSAYGLTKMLGEELVRFHQRKGDFETVILRFSHTQSAFELLDENSFFSGPRFFLKQRIRQLEEFGRTEAANICRSRDPGEPAHILARDEHHRTARMHISDTRDIAEGVLLALFSPEAKGDVFNLGATDPVEFSWLLPKMSGITGYPVVDVSLPGPAVRYHTSNTKIRRTLGFQPNWTINRMLNEAAAAWRMRKPV